MLLRSPLVVAISFSLAPLALATLLSIRTGLDGVHFQTSRAQSYPERSALAKASCADYIPRESEVRYGLQKIQANACPSYGANRERSANFIRAAHRAALEPTASGC